jgi:Holliday junction resolvase RusA-like endonuclease
MNALTFTVPGIAQTKGSARPYTVKRTRKDGTPYIGARVDNDNPKAKSWQKTIASYAAIASRREPLPDGPVILDVWFYFPRPQKFLTKKYALIEVPHVVPPDGDKCLRVVCDSLSGVLYRDDSRVVDAYVHKRYCRAGEVPRTVITARPVSSYQLPVPSSQLPTLFGQEALYS